MRVLGLQAVLAGTLFHASSALLIKSENVSSLSSTLASSANHTAGRRQDFVYDFGFFNGMDSWTYLSTGLRVVAVEADPSLVQAAHSNANFMPLLANGQLTLLNLAIAPKDQDTDSWMTFYLNKCTKEWNSFYSSVGCRSCNSPHAEDMTKASCGPQQVLATPCASVFAQHGTPKYFKLDIEGAETGCYHAMKQQPNYRPAYLSAEVGDDKLIDTFIGLGYKSFKIVRQKSGISGTWGDAAVDCRTANLWRSPDGSRQELQAIFKKAVDPNDPCPGMAVGGSWYDVHASTAVHQTW